MTTLFPASQDPKFQRRPMAIGNLAREQRSLLVGRGVYTVRMGSAAAHNVFTPHPVGGGSARRRGPGSPASSRVDRSERSPKTAGKSGPRKKVG